MVSCAAAATCLAVAADGLTSLRSATGAQGETPSPPDACVRPQAGSTIAEAAELRSHDGLLETDLRILDQKLADGTTRYCYLTLDGKPSPTLRVKPGDELVIHFKNDLLDLDPQTPEIDKALAGAPICTARKKADPCESGAMTPVSSNLHFHGLTVPPVCHQDDVLKTSIQPDDAPFDYRLRIPDDAAPGLYWYHPHLHGFSKTQVLGGASGALIIEGSERANPDLAGLTERVLVIRDQDLVNPEAPPSKFEPPAMSKSQLDSDGDALNSGTGFGKPSKDLSVNFSIIKFIERNWGLEPITHRSRDNYPNPIALPNNPYVPLNSPAISDLFDFGGGPLGELLP